MTTLVLGSQSPRRREILSYFTLPFRQVSPDFDESSLPFENDPEQYVCRLAIGKARSICLGEAKHQELLITADTIVYCHDKVYGKPATKQDAIRTLEELSGCWHSVYTGVTVSHGTQLFSAAEETKVLFNPLTYQEIEHYLHSIRWHDKSGSYTITRSGSLLVKKIEGCFYNVTGLPIQSLRNLLKKFGIDLWDHLGKEL